jgi:hypothetical protein
MWHVDASRATTSNWPAGRVDWPVIADMARRIDKPRVTAYSPFLAQTGSWE